MRTTRLIVRAVVHGESLASQKGQAPYQFRKGDTGIMFWQGAPDQHTLALITVLWDLDTESVPRPTIPAHVECAGLEIADTFRYWGVG